MLSGSQPSSATDSSHQASPAQPTQAATSSSSPLVACSLLGTTKSVSVHTLGLDTQNADEMRAVGGRQNITVPQQTLEELRARLLEQGWDGDDMRGFCR